MITAIALVCAVDNPLNCFPIVKPAFFSTERECLADLESASAHANLQGMIVMDYRCVVWGEPV